MKRLLEAMVVAALLLTATAARATPSTVVWTPATTYTQPFLVPHITYDTYLGETQFGIVPDVGLTMGFIPENKWVEGEIGVDAFYPVTLTDENGKRSSKIPFQFNGKLSLKENSVAAGAPGLSVGLANAGLVTNKLAGARNDFNLVYAVLGKTFSFGTVGVGGYTGNKELFLDKNGKKDNVGAMASFTSNKYAVGTVGLKDISFGVDFASGSSFFSAVAAAAVLNFTDTVALLTGPVYFLDKDIANRTYGAQFAWTVQLDVDLDFSKPKPAPKT
jgi:hypothetical protein